MSLELEKLSQEVYNKINKDKFGIDPLLIIAIANIIINVIKALSIIYFNGNLSKFLSKPNLLTRLIVKREVKKELRKNDIDNDSKKELEEELKKKILLVVQNYGEAELSQLISNLK